MPASEDPLGPRPFGLNARQKAFAEHMHAGMSKRDAYLAAGYKGGGKSSINSAISTLCTHERVQQYRVWLANRDFDPKDGETPADWALTQMRNLALTVKSDQAKVRALELYGRAVGQDWGGDTRPAMEKIPAEQLVAKVAEALGRAAGEVAAAKMGVTLPPIIEAKAIEVEGVLDGKAVE